MSAPLWLKQFPRACCWSQELAPAPSETPRTLSPTQPHTHTYAHMYAHTHTYSFSYTNLLQTAWMLHTACFAEVCSLPAHLQAVLSAAQGGTGNCPHANVSCVKVANVQTTCMSCTQVVNVQSMWGAERLHPVDTR